MYMTAPRERITLQEFEDQLNGFNPLKAIGRALGAGGRALVSAIPVVGGAASTVLTAAAKQPAKASADPVTAASEAVKTALPTPPPAPVTVAAPAAPAGQDFFQQFLMMKALQQPQQPMPAVAPASAPQAPMPMFLPSGGAGPTVITAPAAAPTAGAMPPWLIPAAIGGAALLIVMSQKKGR